MKSLSISLAVNTRSSQFCDHRVILQMEKKGENDTPPSLEEPLNPVAEEAVSRKITAEDQRLCGRPPLKTVFILAIGPIISQVSNAVFLIVNTLWTSKAIGDDGLAAISTYNMFDNSGRAFGFLLSLGAATQISALFGLGKHEEAGQICADLLRLAFVFGAFIPLVLLPSIRPLGVWFGASQTVIDMGWDYMLPLCSFATTTCMYLAVCGFLQGEGRTLLYGLANFACLGLNGLVLDPLFLFGFKTGIRGVSLATVFSEIIPGAVLLVIYYCGKFGVKPKLIQWCHKFSPRTWTAVKVGVSQLIAQLSVTLPSIAVRKFIGMAVGDEFDDAMAGFNCMMRLSSVCMAPMMGITMGFVPAASYAYAAKKYRRYLWLCFHSIWLCIAWGLIAGAFIWSIPREMAKMFSTSERYLDYGEKMTLYANGLAPLQGIRFNCQTILQSMHLGGRATLTGLLNNFVWIIVFTVVLYYTDKNDGSRICWCYALSHVMAIPATVIFLWKPLGRVWRLSKEEKEQEPNELEEVEGEQKETKAIAEDAGFQDPAAGDVEGKSSSSSSEEHEKGEKEVDALPEV